MIIDLNKSGPGGWPVCGECGALIFPCHTASPYLYQAQCMKFGCTNVLKASAPTPQAALAAYADLTALPVPDGWEAPFENWNGEDTYCIVSSGPNGAYARMQGPKAETLARWRQAFGPRNPGKHKDAP